MNVGHKVGEIILNIDTLYCANSIMLKILNQLIEGYSKQIIYIQYYQLVWSLIMHTYPKLSSVQCFKYLLDILIILES